MSAWHVSLPVDLQGM